MKKLSLFQMACSVLVTLVVFMSSCKQDLTVQPHLSVGQIKNVKIENGVLHFATVKDFRDAIDALVAAKTTADRSKLVATTGFESFQKQYEAFVNAMEKAKTSDDELKIAALYGDIITLEDNSYRPKQKNELINYLINKDGFLKVGNAIYKFNNDAEIISFDGDLEAIQRAETSKASTDKVKYLASQQSFAQSRVSCGNIQYGVASTSDRRVEITAQPYLISGPDNPDDPDSQYWVYSYMSTLCHPTKKNWRGNWVDYQTWNNLTINYAYKKIDTGINTYQAQVTNNTSNEYTYSTNYVDVVVPWTLVPPSAISSNQAVFVRIVNDTYYSGGAGPISLNCN